MPYFGLNMVTSSLALRNKAHLLRRTILVEDARAECRLDRTLRCLAALNVSEDVIAAFGWGASHPSASTYRAIREILEG